MTISFWILILTFTSFFTIFALLRLIQWALVKDIYIKYILMDSGIIASYFWILSSLNSTNEAIVNPVVSGLGILVWLFIIPYSYSAIKKSFLKNHPKLSNMYYPIWEFVFFVVGVMWSLSLSEVLVGLIQVLKL